MLISEFVFLKRVLNDALYELFKERKLKNPRIDRTDPDFNKFKRDFNKFKREFINDSQKKFLKEHPTFKFVYIKRSLREIPLKKGKMIPVEKLSEDVQNERGEGGYGSTGVNDVAVKTE